MIIKFKDASEVDLKKVWPVISEDDYSLINGQELTIDADQCQKIKKNKFLNLAGYHISADLIIFAEKSIAAEQIQVQQIVDEKFIYSEEVVDILFAGLENKKNVILWGRGGHGKSEITETVLSELYKAGLLTEEPFVQAFGKGLTEEKLFGGMNIKKYRDEGVIEYLPENSFMNFEVVVFEEIFDAPPSVLLSLKDIMTSKKFRQGTEVFDIKTKVIIGLTNKSKKDFSEKDESLKALAERFQLTLKVEWAHYKKTNFLKLFKKVLGDDAYRQDTQKLSELANIIDMNNAQGVTFVSPRTAVSAAELFLKGKPLEYIGEIDEEILAKYKSSQKTEKFNDLHEKLLKRIDEYIDKHDLDTMDQAEDFLKELSAIEVEIGEEPIDTSFLEPSSNKKKMNKLNKALYLLAIINQTPAQGNQMKQFTQTKQRLQEVVKLSKQAETKEEDVPDFEEVTQQI